MCVVLAECLWFVEIVGIGVYTFKSSLLTLNPTRSVSGNDLPSQGLVWDTTFLISMIAQDFERGEIVVVNLGDTSVCVCCKKMLTVVNVTKSCGSFLLKYVCIGA